MALFDPVYVTEVLNDILSRRGLSASLVLKESQVSSVDQQREKDSTALSDCQQEQTSA